MRQQLVGAAAWVCRQPRGDVLEVRRRAGVVSIDPVATRAASGLEGCASLLTHAAAAAALHRPVTMDEIGRCVAFLVGRHATDMTGPTLCVDAATHAWRWPRSAQRGNTAQAHRCPVKTCRRRGQASRHRQAAASAAGRQFKQVCAAVPVKTCVHTAGGGAAVATSGGCLAAAPS